MKSVDFESLIQIAALEARRRQLRQENGSQAAWDEVERLRTPEFTAAEEALQQDPLSHDAVEGLVLFLLHETPAGQSVLQTAQNQAFATAFKRYEARLSAVVKQTSLQLRAKRAWGRFWNLAWLDSLVPRENPFRWVANSGAFALAACVVLLVVATVAITPGSVVNGYLDQLPSAQTGGHEMGGGPAYQPALSPLQQLYQAQDWAGYLAQYQQTTSPKAEEQLWAGLAFLKTGQPAQAVAGLQSALATDQTEGGVLRDQVRYYLMFALLQNGQADEARQLLNQIRSEPDFGYRRQDLQSAWLGARVKWLSWVG
ncbi:MAG: tetratricopeptide repeat protein [Bernardetiaceae bacterium]|jgi:tetratricopeptide (TPR) repeat protein|nr:tetratricopeptide repeat protein [Bernardetiaceae bacterium]